MKKIKNNKIFARKFRRELVRFAGCNRSNCSVNHHSVSFYVDWGMFYGSRIPRSLRHLCKQFKNS